MTIKVYYDADADLSILNDAKIAILGYGSQGHAHAQNLRDSGLDVVVGVRAGESRERARADGWEPVSVAEAVTGADMAMILLPDEQQARVYAAEIGPVLKPGAALGLAHGFNLHYGQIIPGPGIDVFLVAPKSPGHVFRRLFAAGQGVPGLVAVHQDASGRALARALAYAKGIGCTRAGVIATTVAEETESDLFGEQAVLCGGVTALIQAGFDTLVEAGYQPEIAYFECLNELKLIVDMIYEGGLSWMRYSVSNTAEFGDYRSGPRVIDEHVRDTMRRILADIRSGAFAREWILENMAGAPTLAANRRRCQQSLIETVGRQLRAMMPWARHEEGE